MDISLRCRYRPVGRNDRDRRIALIGLLILTACMWSGAMAQTFRPFFPDTAAIFQIVGEKKVVSTSRPTFYTNWEHYVPDPAHPEYQPERSIRMNFHVMNGRDSSHNFKEAEGRIFLKDLLRYANADLDTNVWNWRSPEGTPALRKGFRFVLTSQPTPGDDGIYFHYDDSLCYSISQGAHANNYTQDVIKKYSIGKDSIVNVFLMAHPPDSLRSKTYKVSRSGIALGTAIKLVGIYETKERAQFCTGQMNHEFGHVFSLQHAWMEDGCPDTQDHPNRCWCWSEELPCRNEASNNMMDYNAYQIAMTPCQIGRVQAVFANETSHIRKYLIPDWCTPRPGQDVVIRDSVAWLGAHDLVGNLTVAPGGSLYLSSRLSMPAGSRITVQPGGRLWLDGARIHNACGLAWGGIWVEDNNREQGRVYVLKRGRMENCPKPGQ